MKKILIALLLLSYCLPNVKSEAFSPPVFKPPQLSEAQNPVQGSFLPSGGGALWLPQYWFAEGFLASDLQANEVQLTSLSGAVLYGWPDSRAVATGSVAPAEKVRLLGIGCWAWPELMVLKAKESLRLDGKGEALRQFGYVSALTSGSVVVYAQGRNMLLPREQLQGPLPAEWGNGESGQWLYLKSHEGVCGWTMFAPERWQVRQPEAGVRLAAFAETAVALNFNPLKLLQVVPAD